MKSARRGNSVFLKGRPSSEILVAPSPNKKVDACLGTNRLAIVNCGGGSFDRIQRVVINIVPHVPESSLDASEYNESPAANGCPKFNARRLPPSASGFGPKALRTRWSTPEMKSVMVSDRQRRERGQFRRIFANAVGIARAPAI